MSWFCNMQIMTDIKSLLRNKFYFSYRTLISLMFLSFQTFTFSHSQPLLKVIVSKRPLLASICNHNQSVFSVKQRLPGSSLTSAMDPWILNHLAYQIEWLYGYWDAGLLYDSPFWTPICWIYRHLLPPVVEAQTAGLPFWPAWTFHFHERCLSGIGKLS